MNTTNTESSVQTECDQGIFAPSQQFQFQQIQIQFPKRQQRQKKITRSYRLFTRLYGKESDTQCQEIAPVTLPRTHVQRHMDFSRGGDGYAKIGKQTSEFAQLLPFLIHPFN